MGKRRHTRSLAGLLAVFLLFSFTLTSSLHTFGFTHDAITKVISKKTNTSRSDTPLPFEEGQENEDMEDDGKDEKDDKTQHVFFLACLPFVFVIQTDHQFYHQGRPGSFHFCGNALHTPLYLAKRTLLI